MDRRERIRNIPGIDAERGLVYCGDEESWLEAVGVFASAVAKRAGRIERFLAEEDAASVAAEAHAVKSTAALIGAQHVSDLAAALEQAGSGGADDIRAAAEQFLSAYRSLGESLTETDG